MTDRWMVAATCYSLACVAYEMLWGRPPFTGTSRVVLLRHIAAEPMPLGCRLPGLPHSISAAICGRSPNRLRRGLRRQVCSSRDAEWPAGGVDSVGAAGWRRPTMRGLAALGVEDGAWYRSLKASINNHDFRDIRHGELAVRALGARRLRDRASRHGACAGRRRVRARISLVGALRVGVRTRPGPRALADYVITGLFPLAIIGAILPLTRAIRGATAWTRGEPSSVRRRSANSSPRWAWRAFFSRCPSSSSATPPTRLRLARRSRHC